ncbi:16S rRNA (guanine(527)-N(7))-methyltransferase RsmG [Bacteroidota bacterium]
MDIVEFWTICSANGIIPEKEQRKQIERYSSELLYWNEKVNLISRKDEDKILSRHVLHSLSVLKYVDIKNKAKCIDIGTGGGLPGIPLKIARPDISMLLVDSIAKKIKITQMLAKHTGLNKIDAICSRAENLGNVKEYKASFDFAFVRAVKKIEIVLGWIKDIIKKDGIAVFYKGGDLTDEISDAKKMFPGVEIKEININLIGAAWLKEDDKKIIICSNIK